MAPINLENIQVKKVIYYNQQSNWGVFSAKDLSTEKKEFTGEIIVAGNFEGIYEGCKLSITAEYAEHPKYGRQLQLQHYKLHEDTSSKEAIINFLTKSSINGIHKALAQKIYAQFKEDSIHVVLHETARLKEIKGIGDKTYDVVAKSVSQYFEMEDLLKYCSEIGLNKFALTMQLYKEFGSEAVRILKENPYQLLVMSEALNFTQVDEIAMKAGIKIDDDNRLKYGLLYVLTRESVLRGSTGCPDMQLKQTFLKTLGLQNNQLYRYALTKLDEENEIYRDDDNVYLREFYDAERNVAMKLQDINREIPLQFEQRVIDEELSSFPFKLNDDQVKAIYSCLTHQFSVITSLAGCGKTTITKAIIKIISRHHGTIKLIAPTAKAAKRLSECAGFKASTIHRFLKIADSTLRSTETVIVPRNTTIIIDEASMVDVRLFERVLESLMPDTRVIIVGDTHQLPSVQAGNLLEDIITSESFNVCYLRDITRQADDSNIIKYSNMVNEGQFIPLDLRTHDLLCTTGQKTQREQAVELVKNSYMKSVEKYGLLNVQLICAYKGGILGVNNLNKVLRNARLASNPIENSSEDEEIFPFKIGDKVRHTINNYKLDVYNGETGVVVSIQSATDDNNFEGKDLLVVDYGDRHVTYDKFTANELTLSYASTVHASQGSEYDCVYVVLDNEISNILLVRKIVYTAITRAKKKCYIVNIDGCVNTAISNDHYKERITKLKEFIHEIPATAKTFEKIAEANEYAVREVESEEDYDEIPF